MNSRASESVANASILVGIATYNEIENLPSLVEKTLSVVPNCRILIVDDNSPDRTGDWCDDFSKRDDRLGCIHRAGKSGLGTAAIASLQYAVDHRFDWLVQLDADHSHDPCEIPGMLQTAIHSTPPVDVVIGSRYVDGGKIHGWPWRRHWTSQMVNMAARWGLGIPARDCSGSFRCYRVETLQRLKLAKLKSTGYSIYEELLAELHRVGARMVEVPITFVDRERGNTKAGFGEVLQAAIRLLWLMGQSWTRRS